MHDFGFTISKARVIDYDNSDLRILKYIRENEPTFDICFFCGSCTATCSAGAFTNFNIRDIKMKIQRGITTNLAEEASKCMMCGKCYLVCPRGVNNRNIIKLIRQALTKTENHEL